MEPLPVDPLLLERANWWFDISWYGLLWAGAATALAACATVVFLFLQFWSSGVRERHSEWRTSSLELQTEQAKRDTAAAQERIAALNKETARLSGEAESARASIADADARAAQAQQKAAEADLARLRLEAKLAPRTLNEAQISAVAAKLVPFAGTRVDLIVFSQGSTSDTPMFGITLEKVFLAANWKPLSWTAMGGGAVVTGVLIAIKDGSETDIEKAADAVGAALNAEGIDAGRYSKLDFKTGDLKEVPVPGVNGPPWDQNNVAPIRILIGTKP